MNLTFSEEDMLNTVAIASSNGAALYQTETHHIANRVTTIRRFMPDSGPQVIAEIHWGNLTFHSPKVHYRGHEVNLDDFLGKDGFFHPTRTFTAIDGKQYKWKRESNKFLLFSNTDHQVAETHRAHMGLFSKPRKASIDIATTAHHILDDIIVTLTIVVSEAKRQSRSNVAVISAVS